MKLGFNLSRYAVHALSGACALGIGVLASTMRSPVPEREGVDAEDARSARQSSAPFVDENIPSMNEVLSLHLFVPERKATGENSYPDLVVKGVYVGSERNAVFSLKSKPQTNLRVWAGDEQAAFDSIEDPRDPRQNIVDFLNEWNIQEITFDGVRVEHFITGEVETYKVDYTPQKKVKDNAERGYGQGLVVQTGGGGGGSKQVSQQPSGGGQQQRSPQFMAGRLNALMGQMNPQQRQAFMNRMRQSGGGNNGQAKQSNQNGNNKKSSKKAAKKSAKKSSKKK